MGSLSSSSAASAPISAPAAADRAVSFSPHRFLLCNCYLGVETKVSRCLFVAGRISYRILKVVCVWVGEVTFLMWKNVCECQDAEYEKQRPA